MGNDVHLGVVVGIAIVAHHIAHSQSPSNFGGQLKSALTQAAAIICVNIALAALMPSTTTRRGRLAGVTILAVFSASYLPFLYAFYLEPPHAQTNLRIRFFYVVWAILVGTFSAVLVAAKLLDAWVAARLVHVAHCMLVSLCRVYTVLTLEGEDMFTIPTYASPGCAPIFMVTHLLLALGLSRPVRYRINELLYLNFSRVQRRSRHEEEGQVAPPAPRQQAQGEMDWKADPQGSPLRMDATDMSSLLPPSFASEFRPLTAEALADAALLDPSKLDDGTSSLVSGHTASTSWPNPHARETNGRPACYPEPVRWGGERPFLCCPTLQRKAPGRIARALPPDDAPVALVYMVHSGELHEVYQDSQD